ncbi:MAG: sugar ABC transporter substrate-binding protein [Verrucomicrobia bacterium]|nr:sugar ABC transporter substrate-binding protein [Verrucomicrobiota bacterium]
MQENEHSHPQNSHSEEQLNNTSTAEGITRRQLLKRGGKAAVVAAVSSVFSPFNIHVKAAAVKKLSFWQFYAPAGQVGSQTKWWEDMAKAWNTSHDVKVELQFVPNAEYMNGSKLQTAFASGQGPDLFIISPGDFLRYYNGGVLMDLTPYMEDAAKKDFYENVMETRIVDGKIYGLPMEVEPMAMYYGKKAFADAGLSEADLPKTWEQLLEVAKKLTKGNQFGCVFETTPGYYQTFSWYPFMWQGGGDIVTKDGRKSAFNSEATVQALKFWQDAIKQNVAPRSALGFGGPDIVANLAAGYCAIQNVGIWGISALRENAPNFEYGVFPCPIPSNGQPKTDLGGWAFVANAKGKDPETAAKFCVWALGSMSDDSIQRVVDWCTKAKSDIAPRKSALEKATAEGGYSSGPMKLFKEEIFPTGRGEPRVPPEVYKAISDAIQACQLGGADPHQQAAQASSNIDAFLAAYSGAPLK